MTTKQSHNRTSVSEATLLLKICIKGMEEIEEVWRRFNVKNVNIQHFTNLP